MGKSGGTDADVKTRIGMGTISIQNAKKCLELQSNRYNHQQGTFV